MCIYIYTYNVHIDIIQLLLDGGRIQDSTLSFQHPFTFGVLSRKKDLQSSVRVGLGFFGGKDESSDLKGITHRAVGSWGYRCFLTGSWVDTLPYDLDLGTSLLITPCTFKYIGATS